MTPGGAWQTAGIALTADIALATATLSPVNPGRDEMVMSSLMQGSPVTCALATARLVSASWCLSAWKEPIGRRSTRTWRGPPTR